jgi:diguanylate cyclase (GGDEF)-like protein
MIGVTLGVDPSGVARRPDLLIAPLGLLGATATLSMALMRSDLHHRSAAVVDPLTGMLNRAALTTRAAELAQQAGVVHQPVALVLGDLDHFKTINDEHGHARGDAVLTDVAYRLRKQLRAYDLAYRIGGEEFLVVVPGADAEQACELAEALRGALAAAPVAGLAVTMSFGVAASPAGAFDLAATFARADEALYRAKEHGRDVVVVDGAAVVPALA